MIEREIYIYRERETEKGRDREKREREIGNGILYFRLGTDLKRRHPKYVTQFRTGICSRTGTTGRTSRPVYYLFYISDYRYSYEFSQAYKMFLMRKQKLFCL